MFCLLCVLENFQKTLVFLSVCMCVCVCVFNEVKKEEKKGEKEMGCKGVLTL